MSCVISPPAPKSVVGTVAGLFSGIGGLELGMHSAGFESTLLCEYWEPAASTLRRRFPGVEVLGDIRDLRALPSVDVVTAGFPCTDLSQVGRTRGIDGEESGLVREVFRLLATSNARWVVLENVPNMLSLGGGRAISVITDWFEAHGWNWAYRTVDSQHFGLPQRRRRVLLVASRVADPREVLFADDGGTPAGSGNAREYGFYWTEGNRGVGWGHGVVPTLKGGSKLGIASPPAVWRPSRDLGSQIVRPSIAAGERLQGFRAGWTDHVVREGHRWKLVGNAVSVPVAAWVASRLVNPGVILVPETPWPKAGWPKAASMVGGARQAWQASERPLPLRRGSLGRVLDVHGSVPLSHGATRGFADRFRASSLREQAEGFQDALDAHAAAMS